MALKWGIAGAGRISNDFVNALGTLNEKDHEVVAVAARDLSRAKEFAQRFGIPKAHGSYLELASDPKVEVVYVGTLNPQHFEVALMMLEHGKHVLVEKSLCLNEKQAQQLIAYAKQKNLFLMEAIWSRCFPSYHYVCNQIKDGVLGDITMVEAEIGFEGLDTIDNISKKKLGGGAVLAFGVYPIQICQLVYQQAPKSIAANGTLNEDGVDVEGSVEVNYGENKMGKMRFSAINTLNNKATIIGTKGKITVCVYMEHKIFLIFNKTRNSYFNPLQSDIRILGTIFNY